jgi:hypothetical protein
MSGNAIKRGVSAAYLVTGARLRSWCTGQTPVRLGIEPAPAITPGKENALAALRIRSQLIAVPSHSEPPNPAN